MPDTHNPRLFPQVEPLDSTKKFHFLPRAVSPKSERRAVTRTYAISHQPLCATGWSGGFFLEERVQFPDVVAIGAERPRHLD